MVAKKFEQQAPTRKQISDFVYKYYRALYFRTRDPRAFWQSILWDTKESVKVPEGAEST